MSTHHSAAPWRVVQGDRCLHVVSEDAGFSTGCISFDGLGFGNANIVAAAPDLLAALNAASGYLLNAKIDLETGCPKATAIATIEGGLKVVRAAIARAEGKGQAA
jgi:hypothetical protein